MTLLSQGLSVDEAYLRSTPLSRAMYERACRVMPGGTTRTSIYFEPYPLYIEDGAGCRIRDVDGTERLDLICNYTAMILGHAHPGVVAAVQEQVAKGTSFASANTVEVDFATLLCERVPSFDLVRFTNSGTEATMLALRVARACTGRSKVAFIEGGYHGSHDFAQVSTTPDLALAGPGHEPVAVSDSAGVPTTVLDHAVILPFNDVEAAERLLTRHRHELAAVIVEPIIGSGGCIPAEPGYLEALRDLTTSFGMLLVFDEVISFRAGPGGAQERYGVTPDLTTLGKLLGGGLPVAAFGGRGEFMEVLDPRRPTPMPHAGSFNGHPLGMAAGLATLERLTPDVYDELNANGDHLRTRLRALLASHRVTAQVTGDASLFTIHFTSGPVRNHRDVRAGDAAQTRRFLIGLINHGVLLNQHCMGALSTPVGRAEIDEFIAAADGVLAESWSNGVLIGV